ncbi:MAG: hypothetical protein E5W38_08195 [Mesorhizobium sp.]|uniref:hypothetical protein n=1 Tax=Mesorhizobium sp. TaxID=1871066 RepID=UPI000FE46215|nr:hypothetical protein [Mesorhizobium sp.]RWA88116.1 MAG: hypothetical protein EOQ31_21360 [Mesorhizobium sp.]TIU33757.1 MAG: hypothetical protein E5W38_08195 [Mesorhizobium sp.]
MMTPSNLCCEKFELFASDRHELWDATQVPIGVGYLGVADVGRQRRHGVVDIGAVFVPQLNTATDEGVAEIVDTHLAMATSSAPTKFGSQLLEDDVVRPLRDKP